MRLVRFYDQAQISAATMTHRRTSKTLANKRIFIDKGRDNVSEIDEVLWQHKQTSAFSLLSNHN